MGCVVNATPRLLYPWERYPVPILEEAVWAAGRKNLWALPGFDPRTGQPLASSYTDYRIPAHGACTSVNLLVVYCIFLLWFSHSITCEGEGEVFFVVFFLYSTSCHTRSEVVVHARYIFAVLSAFS
jgi:hypothetical protein